jgi:hypothetical protein
MSPRKRERTTRQALDHALFTALTRKWDKTRVEGYSRSMQKRTAATPAHVTEVLERLDTKAAGLLAFVAMMIAGLGIIAPMVAQHPIEEAVVITQISVYLLIAIGCLRCLSVLNTPEPEADVAHEEVRKHADRELIIRQELFRICHRVSIAFTILVCIGLPLMLVWRPV